jgi:hypothetical protein
VNISLIPYRAEAFHVLGEQVTHKRVLDLFRHRGATAVHRHDLPLIAAYNFVVDNVLEGGVNTALNLDGHGKTLSFRLLALDVTVPAGLLLHPACAEDASPAAAARVPAQ